MRILALAFMTCLLAALAGCRGEGPPGKNSEKDRPRPATEQVK